MRLNSIGRQTAVAMIVIIVIAVVVALAGLPK